MHTINTGDKPLISYETHGVIAATPHVVYEAIDTINGIQAWWAPKVQGSTETGDTIRIAFPSADEFIIMRVKDKQQDTHIVWECIERRGPDKANPDEWVGTTITFTIERQNEQQSLLKVTHKGVEAEGWDYFLSSITRYIETGKGTPFV